MINLPEFDESASDKSAINYCNTRGRSRGRVQGVRGRGPPPPPPTRDDLWFSNTTGILRKKKMWFIGVEVQQETGAPPPKKNPGSAPEHL